MNTQKSGHKTLLTSVILSSPGPLIVGLGLMVGKSSTQLADFVRRSSELLAIIISYIIYTVTTKENGVDMEKKQKLERISNLCVGIAMIVGGCIMFVLALTSNTTEKGNVIPGLTIALLGVFANSLFWRKYTKLNEESPNAILEVQARLYRAKALVDSCVSIALLSVLWLPNSSISYYLDLLGTIIVSIYLVYCGYQTFKEYM